MKEERSGKIPKFPPPAEPAPLSPPPNEPAPFFVMLDDLLPLLKASINTQSHGFVSLALPQKEPDCNQRLLPFPPGFESGVAPISVANLPPSSLMDKPTVYLPESNPGMFMKVTDSRMWKPSPLLTLEFARGVKEPLFLTPTSSARTEENEYTSPRLFIEGSPLVETEEQFEGVHAGPACVNGSAIIRAEWRISHFCKKLSALLGKPLVSPPFAAAGLRDLRLIIFPCLDESRQGRQNKSKFAQLVKCGPFDCAMKLKVPIDDAPILEFYLTLGSCFRRGPFRCDFRERSIEGCDGFNIDWLQHVDGYGNLQVGLDIFEISSNHNMELADCNYRANRIEGIEASH